MFGLAKKWSPSGVSRRPDLVGGRRSLSEYAQRPTGEEFRPHKRRFGPFFTAVVRPPIATIDLSTGLPISVYSGTASAD